MSFIKYIADENHYKEVLSLVGKAKQMVWIGTADIKDLYGSASSVRTVADVSIVQTR